MSRGGNRTLTRLRATVMVVALGVAVAGCTGSSQPSSARHPHHSSPSARTHRPARAHHEKHRAMTAAAGRAAAHRPGHSGRGHVAGVPAVDLPNRALTPGAVLTTSRAKICTPGYASSVRDVPESEATAVYDRYHVVHVPYAHEVDHLVSLELGGSNAITNLWPEPYAGRWGAHTKDAIENELHDLVCAGRLSLTDAQHIEATNWVAAYRRYIGAPPAPPASTRTTRTSGPSTGTGHGCEPGYSPCLPRVADLDCADIPASDKPVRVTGTDPYGLDANHDGWGCTS
jgi:hypothetical protein